MKKILLLDDSQLVHSDLEDVIPFWGYQLLHAETISEAAICLQQGIDFAIVDVFLDGAEGDELSAGFIRDYLEPAKIPYGRFTSAPESVPDDQRGQWVLHKYHVRQDSSLLQEALINSCGV